MTTTNLRRHSPVKAQGRFNICINCGFGGIAIHTSKPKTAPITAPPVDRFIRGILCFGMKTVRHPPDKLPRPIHNILQPPGGCFYSSALTAALVSSSPISSNTMR